MRAGALRWGAAPAAALAFSLALPAVAQSETLTVRVVGDGKVTSSPAGIDCPRDCSQDYPRGRTSPQTVRLTAAPGAGQRLEAWGESCLGAGSCSILMDADKVLTAKFAPASPPPPPSPAPPPGSGALVLAVSAGGDVASTPAGIACPPDCAENLPLQSSFTLLPTAHSGFAFARWEGACTGTGACAGTIAELTFVRAVFTPLRPTGSGAEGDSDGVPEGRTALDLVRDAGGALDPLRAKIDGARAGLRNVPGLGRVRRELGRLGGLLNRGRMLIGQGKACGAAGQLRRAARRLENAEQTAGGLIDQLQRTVLLPALGPAFGDTAEKDLRWAELNMRRRLLGDAAELGADVGLAFDGACRAFGRRVVLSGIVTETDDQTGMLRLSSGQRLLLPPLGRFGNRVFEGARVKIVARGGVGAGPAIVSSVATAESAAPSLNLAPCMQLRIAPFQDFSVATPVVHHPLGYEQDGKLWLEQGARLAASPKCSYGKGRYSLAIEVSLKGNTYTVAEDLTAADDPVGLPVGSGPLDWTLTVRERRQLSNCPPPGASPSAKARATKSFPCPVQEVSTTEYKVRILNTAGYATAVYDKTKFALDAEAPAFVTVTGLTGKHASVPATASIVGEGYKTTGTVNTGQYVVIAQGETWTLYPKQLYGFDAGLLFPLATVGVDHFAGLLWPRVVGTRNGRPFRYAAALPAIVTDLLAFCPGKAEDCAYQPPWPFQVEYSVGQGNGPGFSHNGPQLYAFDFSLPDGSAIVAARGGVVGDVVENLTKNYNPCDPATPKADGPANYVRIDHQDGTYAYYAHLKTNTVPVAVGDQIGRGAPVGQADNTGRSCGPHLHFQVSTVKTQQYYGQTLRIRFQTWVKGQSSPDAQNCYIPKTGDVLISTNG